MTRYKKYYSSELTKREQQIYDAIVEYGYKKSELAYKFGVTFKTMDKHLDNILTKKGFNSQKELIIAHYKKLLEDKING